jgi:hypothetical protein
MLEIMVGHIEDEPDSRLLLRVFLARNPRFTLDPDCVASTLESGLRVVRNALVQRSCRALVLDANYHGGKDGADAREITAALREVDPDGVIKIIGASSITEVDYGIEPAHRLPAGNLSIVPAVLEKLFPLEPAS